MKQAFTNQIESFRNPYRESRDRAGMSQEAAAEALHISTRTLWSYWKNSLSVSSFQRQKKTASSAGTPKADM